MNPTYHGNSPIWVSLIPKVFYHQLCMWLFKEFTSVIIELIHAFRSAHIEVWHTGSLMSTQEARIALSHLSSNSCASLKPSKLLTFIYASTKHIKFELIPQFLSSWLSKFQRTSYHSSYGLWIQSLIILTDTYFCGCTSILLDHSQIQSVFCSCGRIGSPYDQLTWICFLLAVKLLV